MTLLYQRRARAPRDDRPREGRPAAHDVESRFVFDRLPVVFEIGKLRVEGIDVKAAVVDRETIAVTVTDRGVGIAESEQVLIFEKFYRGRVLAYRKPGTGMGLAISRAIVEAHHGTIGVSSALGEGSTFTVRLPIWRGTSYIG